jgi:hypothetical protein
MEIIEKWTARFKGWLGRSGDSPPTPRGRPEGSMASASTAHLPNPEALLAKLASELPSHFPLRDHWGNGELQEGAWEAVDRLETLRSAWLDSERSKGALPNQKLFDRLELHRSRIALAGVNAFKASTSRDLAGRVAGLATRVAFGGVEASTARLALWGAGESAWPREALTWAGEFFDALDASRWTVDDWGKAFSVATVMVNAARHTRWSEDLGSSSGFKESLARTMGGPCAVAFLIHFPNDPMDPGDYAQARLDFVAAKHRPRFDEWMALQEDSLSWRAMFRAQVAALESETGIAPPPLGLWLDQTLALRQKRLASRAEPELTDPETALGDDPETSAGPARSRMGL